MSKGFTYERQTQRVLTGGWNLLPPNDLISETEAAQVENFRVDTAGNLRSRLGHGNVIYNTGAVESFCQVKGSSTRRYSATYLGFLWRNGTSVQNMAGKTGMVSYQGYLWAMSQSVQKKDDGTNVLAWTPAAPTIQLGAGAANPGDVDAIAGGSVIPLDKVYTYWVTYSSASGQESLSSAGVTLPAIASGFSIVRIKSPTNPADAERTHYNVYRVGDTLQAAYRVNTSPIALGVDFTDSFDPKDGKGDYQLTQLGIILDPDASGPPAGNGLAGPYYDRLLAWGVAGKLNRLYYSGTLQPYNFPGSALTEGNHVGVGELGEAIVGVTIRPRVATVYKDSSIWRLVGDPGDLDGDLERVTSAYGAMSPPISVGQIDYFEGKEGLYSYNGDRVQKISGKLDPLFRGETPEAAGFAYSPVAPLIQTVADRANNRLCHRNGRLYFFYCSVAPGVPNTPTRGMSTLLGADNWCSDGRGISAMLDEGQNGLMLASIASLGSAVYSMEEGETDAGSGIVCQYQSGFQDQGAPEQVKTYADVVIEHNTGNSPVVVSAYYNNGTQKEPIGTIQSTVKTVTTLQLNTSVVNPFTGLRLGWQAKNVAIRLEGTTVSGPIQIQKIILHYFVEPRDSKTYDSDETDLGTQKVKLISELELDIDYPALGGGTITWELFAGLASANCALADANTIAATVGRQKIRIPVAAGIEARLIRVALRCDTALSTFRLYGLRVRALPIGEWHDGARGEYFTTFEIH